MQDQVFKIVGHIPHPFVVAAFAFVFAAVVFVLLLRSKIPILATVSTVVIVILGLAPFVASTFLKSRSVYRINVVVLRPDQSLADIAQVQSSIGGGVETGA